MIRLFIVEDHPVIVAGLKNMFRPSRDNIEITGSAANVDEMLNHQDPDKFDIIILDLWISSTSPLENMQQLQQHFPGKPIIIYTTEDSSYWQRKMFTLGAKAYTIKTSNKSELKAILEKVAEGQTIFSGSFNQSPSKKFSFGHPNKMFSLTTNQKEIVHLLSRGLTMKKMAEITGTSVSNIEKTVKHIRDLFDAKNNTELMRIFKEYEE